MCSCSSFQFRPSFVKCCCLPGRHLDEFAIEGSNSLLNGSLDVKLWQELGKLSMRHSLRKRRLITLAAKTLGKPPQLVVSSMTQYDHWNVIVVPKNLRVLSPTDHLGRVLSSRTTDPAGAPPCHRSRCSKFIAESHQHQLRGLRGSQS